FQGQHSLKQMIEAYSEIYLKAARGHKGLGVYKIGKVKNNFSIESSNWAKSFNSFYELCNEILGIVGSEEFIIQESISSDLFEGKRYDLRVLAHYQKNSYIISGIGIRLAGTQQITTHVPNGGTLLKYEKISARIDRKIIQTIVTEIGTTLSTQLDKFIGEFSVDIGKSKTGLYYIYEVNSKR